jgi:hypothetical protein
MITCYLRPAIRHTLSDYVDGNKTFNDTRSALRDLMNRAAVIEYRSYVRPTIASSQES